MWGRAGGVVYVGEGRVCGVYGGGQGVWCMWGRAGGVVYVGEGRGYKG